MSGLLSKLFRPKAKDEHPFCSVIVAAAGCSSRMEGANKLMLPLDGIPVLARTLLALDGALLVDEIVVAVREEDLLPTGDLCKTYGITKPTKIVRGGSDGARPLAEPELIDRVIALAHNTNAAAPAVPVKDTIKIVRENVVERTPDRASLRAVQTPQAFDAQLLRAALQSAQTSGIDVTDDCSAVELLGKEVYLTNGSYENIKITTPEDMLLAAELLRRREELQ